MDSFIQTHILKANFIISRWLNSDFMFLIDKKHFISTLWDRFAVIA